VLELFRNGLAVRTLALWLAFFCCLLMVYALSSWLPKLMANAGYSLGSSLSFLLVLNFGGMAGAILGGWLGDRYNLVKVVASSSPPRCRSACWGSTARCRCCTC
jgi:AAHS family benzoate transporter-like MFS transporter